MKRSFENSERITNEHGVVIMLLAVLLVVVFGIVAMVVDGSRQTIVVEHVQNAADAASLAAAKQLNGKPSGMRAAKRAAVAVLKQVSIHGATGTIPASFQLNEPTAAPVDPYEIDDPGNHYTKLEGTAGNVRVRIERGYYHDAGSLNGEPNFQFQSLEGTPTLFDVDSHVLANAVRTTIEISNVPTSFGRVLGATDLGTVTRSSVSVFDSELEPCVLPLAIPLCQLMMNTGPNPEFEDLNYNPAEQCEREWWGMEAAPIDGPNSPREHDLWQANWYYLPPYYTSNGTADLCHDNQPHTPGSYLNCKAFRENAVLGVPTNDPSLATTPATPQEVAQVLSGNLGCINSRVGASFRPLEHAVNAAGNPIGGASGFFDNPSLSNKIRDLIKNSPDSVPFNSVYLPSGVPASYPYARRLIESPDPDIALTELRVRWPISQTPGYGEMIMDTKGVVPSDPFHWVNPILHHPQLAEANAKIKPVKVMVISNGDPAFPYCDFPHLFAQQEQISFTPKSNTSPKVVGFLNAYILDGYNMQLPSVIPGNGNPVSAVMTEAMVDYVDDLEHFVSDHQSWGGCEHCVVCTPQPCGGQGEPNCHPHWCSDSCPPCGPPPAPPTPPAAIPAYFTECFKPLPVFNDPGVNYQNDPEYQNYVDYMEGLGGEASALANTGLIASKDGMHCLPKKIHGCFPGDDPGCWVVEDMNAQYPPGLRIKPSCQPGQVISGSNSTSDAKPMIVN